MAILKFTIDSIMGGQSPMFHGAGKGQYLGSQSIDPEQGLNSRASAQIRPVGYATFSASAVSGAPMWIMTDPNQFLVYIYNSDGEVITYDTGLASASETVVGTPTNGAGNGGAFYNNFYYFITPTDVSRFGPADGTVTRALTNNVWTGSTLGTQLALVNTSYPTIKNYTYPNHAAHVHTDNALYFSDFINGKGVIHKIQTNNTPQLAYDGQTGNFTVGLVITGGTSGATARIISDADAGAAGTLNLFSITGTFQDNEIITDTSTGSAAVNGTLIPVGAVNDGSSYNVLDLPQNIKPFDIESFGTDLAILGSGIGVSAVINQGKSFLFLWDTVSDTFYRQVPIPAMIVTAILNVNGTLFIWGGSLDKGWQLFRYTGGYQVDQLWASQEGSPPLAGAVDISGGRVAWGGYQATLGGGANIWSRGYFNEQLGTDAINNIGIVANLAAGDNPVITALKYIQQLNHEMPVVGFRTSTAFGMSKLDLTAAKQAFFWSQNFSMDSSFKVRGIRIPLTGAVVSGLEIAVTLRLDNGIGSGAMTEINNTNFPGALLVDYKPLEIDSVMAGTVGRKNFDLQFQWSNTSAIGLALPIEIIVETLDD